MSNLMSPMIEPKLHHAPLSPPLTGRIVVIDDEINVGKSLCALLGSRGHVIVTAPGGQEGLEAVRKEKFDVAPVDLVMPVIDGIRTLAALKEIDPGLEVIMMTGYATVDSTIAALREGAGDFL